MISIGFRLKLLLAMLAMVALCTVVMLKVSLRRVEAANDRLFRNRVDEQLTYLPRVLSNLVCSYARVRVPSIRPGSERRLGAHPLLGWA